MLGVKGRYFGEPAGRLSCPGRRGAGSCPALQYCTVAAAAHSGGLTMPDSPGSFLLCAPCCRVERIARYLENFL